MVPSTVVEEQEVRELMRAEIDKLPEREKLVLSLYYDEGLTLAQISRVLGVSESRVPQIHTKSVLHLRAPHGRRRRRPERWPIRAWRRWDPSCAPPTS